MHAYTYINYYVYTFGKYSIKIIKYGQATLTWITTLNGRSCEIQ